MSPPDGMERLNEFPFVLTQEEVVQDSHVWYQVVVNRGEGDRGVTGFRDYLCA
jgi:hypothetical protein